jgi:hypothetical protein
MPITSPRPRVRGEVCRPDYFHATGIQAMKAYRDDVRARIAAYGRMPDDCKMLFPVLPILGDSHRHSIHHRNRLLRLRSGCPAPPITTNGERGSLGKFAQRGAVRPYGNSRQNGLTGQPSRSPHLRIDPFDPRNVGPGRPMPPGWRAYGQNLLSCQKITRGRTGRVRCRPRPAPALAGNARRTRRRTARHWSHTAARAPVG